MPYFKHHFKAFFVITFFLFITTAYTLFLPNIRDAKGKDGLDSERGESLSSSPDAPFTDFVVDHDSIDYNDDIIPQYYLDQARNLDVIFGHASVGGNILSGLDSLEVLDSARYSIDRTTSENSAVLISWFDSGAGIGDFAAGVNGNPGSKITELNQRVVTDGVGSHVDIAFVKYCYVDNAGDVNAVWIEYRDYMLAMETVYPDVAFVWWTMPLETTGDSWRDSYNTLVRNYTEANDKILFDIADIEAHDPDGNHILQGGYEAMYSNYTDDGGHLDTNADIDDRDIGTMRMGRAFWWLFARISGWDPDDTYENNCIGIGGSWVDSLEECRAISESDCTLIGGVEYDECVSPCIDLPEGTKCVLHCASACRFGASGEESLGLGDQEDSYIEIDDQDFNQNDQSIDRGKSVVERTFIENAYVWARTILTVFMGY
ncbi:MAG: hypothetical protein PHS44_02695 [Candidatus Dojkabacteria bacterium]|nr:hypothetical protein [Candidatus Dojkabacteria bacterium]